MACNNVNKVEEEKEEETWKILTWMVYVVLVELKDSWKDEVVCVAVIAPATDEDMYGNVVGSAKSNNMIRS